MCIRDSTHTYARTHARTHAHTHTHTRTHARTHAHTHTHARARAVNIEILSQPRKNPTQIGPVTYNQEEQARKAPDTGWPDGHEGRTTADELSTTHTSIVHEDD